ncbi:MAG TPA: hypothetical protein ACHBX0_05820 [Arsenophonus sp.]
MATPDEVIETTIKGVGTEAISSPAQDGDWVVENICLATGNEQYLVEKGKFHQYCHDPVTVLSKPNYLHFIPTGKMINYFILLSLKPNQCLLLSTAGEKTVVVCR